jgi:hypothetical protein
MIPSLHPACVVERARHEVAGRGADAKRRCTTARPQNTNPSCQGVMCVTLAQ